MLIQSAAVGLANYDEPMIKRILVDFKYMKILYANCG